MKKLFLNCIFNECDTEFHACMHAQHSTLNKLSGIILVAERLRVHVVREDRVHHQSRHRFQDQPDDRRCLRQFGAGLRSWKVGPNGQIPQLFWTRQPRHIHRNRSLHWFAYLPAQSHLRRVRRPLRVVLWLHGGYIHWTPHCVFPDHLLRWSVAGHWCSSIQADGYSWWVSKFQCCCGPWEQMWAFCCGP